MAQSISFDATQSRIVAKLNSYITRARDARALLNGPIQKIYIDAQLRRFNTENASETGQWKPLSTKPFYNYWDSNPALRGYWPGGYEAYKRQKYAAFAEGGTKINVATGALRDGLTGNVGAGYRKVVTTKSLVISLDDSILPYAKYVALERPFMNFGSETILKIQEVIGRYMLHGEGGDE